jgi:hypothetical protein
MHALSRQKGCLPVAPYLCPNCRRLLHFEARVCPNCTATLGFEPKSDGFLFLADERTTWRDGEGGTHGVVVCANNNEHQVCNWLVGLGSETGFCLACRHNQTIPDLTVPAVPERWSRIEAAKRRLFHTLLHLHLPIETVADAPNGEGLRFEFLYDPAAENADRPQVLTGHDGGLITLNIVEADDAHRERIRAGLGEPYRTLLGHFRHEVGHYYWNRLVKGQPEEESRCKAVFGDHDISYEEALSEHYAEGGNAWTTDFVSSYATMHPWEDFAETFAHLLHIVDALATLRGFGMGMTEWPGQEEPKVDFDPYQADVRALVNEWVPFSFAQNAISRSMGQPDLYPFHLSDVIVVKLDYIRELLRAGATVEHGGKRMD